MVKDKDSKFLKSISDLRDEIKGSNKTVLEANLYSSREEFVGRVYDLVIKKKITRPRELKFE